MDGVQVPWRCAPTLQNSYILTYMPQCPPKTDLSTPGHPGPYLIFLNLCPEDVELLQAQLATPVFLPPVKESPWRTQSLGAMPSGWPTGWACWSSQHKHREVSQKDLPSAFHTL